MIHLKLQFNTSPLQYTNRGNAVRTFHILIHKPRTTVLSRLESSNQFLQAIPNNSIKLTAANIKANPSIARNLSLDTILLISTEHTLDYVYNSPFHTLLGLTGNSASSFKFIPASEAATFSAIKNSLTTKSRDSLFIANARSISIYLALEKLAQNPHLIPTINNDVYRTLRFISKIVNKVTANVLS